MREGKLRFIFFSDWQVVRYDGWSFHRQFQNICGGAKAVDFLAVTEDNNITWLIEVKDYREHRRTKPSELPHEVACKFRDTLAGLVCARVNSNEPEERDMADLSLRTKQLRLALHLEQPLKHSKLFPKAYQPADIQQKLKTLTKAIDPHPLVLDMQSDSTDWQVENI